MKIEFDLVKSEKNARDRNLPFHFAEDSEWETASYLQDDRREYSERRFVAVGFLEERLHVLCFTPTTDGVRMISFRKANDREVRNYEKKTTDR